MPVDERLIQVPIEDEMRSSYLDYAMSVIVGRALPDVRDGLKPVHRRILYGMNEMGLAHNRAYRKSAKIVGEIMGNYHPHGDTAIYDTLVRMAQDFNMRYLLVDGQGNYGSVDGDPPAAMRYTEARLTRLAEEMLADIDKETVDFGPNYDEPRTEPLVLPAKVPNLLINGAGGIAVGYATNIPTHNLAEVVDGLLMVLDNPEVTVEDLMRAIPGPDFPTAALIYGTQGIKDAYRTGRGLLTLRAKARVETDERTERDRIIVTEIPYQVNKARLIEKIAELIAEERAHVPGGLKIGLDHPDAGISLTRRAASPDEARSGLMRQFALTEIQANAILDMKLQRLTQLERNKLVEEYQETLKRMEYLRSILASEPLVRKLITDELLAAKEAYKDDRRTQIIPEEAEIDIEDMIAEEEEVVTISHAGYIKRNAVSLYRAQRRGGKGKIGVGNKEEGFVETLFTASTHDYLLFFTGAGEGYWVKVHEIPDARP